MGLNNVFYNGTDLNSLGFAITHKPVYRVAKRNITFAKLYGHDGDIIEDEGTFQNVIVPYEINTIPYLLNRKKTNQEITQHFVDWLSDYDGQYKILRDSFNTGYFTHAICSNIDDIVYQLERTLTTTIEFNRCPFWYSDEGQKQISLDFSAEKTIQTATIFNPEQYTANPYFKIWATGEITLKVNDITVKIRNIEDYIEIDCESKDFFKGVIDCNQRVSTDYMPYLKKGKNTITVIANNAAYFRGVDLIPRWRRL